MEDLGYRPLKLTLKGFKGVRSGLGRETLALDLEALVGEGSLVAIAGANGRDKTTVMGSCQLEAVGPRGASADGLAAVAPATMGRTRKRPKGAEGGFQAD